jgi:hypothetical protein
MTHHDRINDQTILESELILPKLTHTFIGVDTDIARGGLKIAPQDLHEGGLTRTVGPDQSITIAISELDGNIFEERFSSELYGDISGGDQVLFPEKRCCKKAAILYVFAANSEKPLWCGGFLKQIEYQYHPAFDAVSGCCLGISA